MNPLNAQIDVGGIWRISIFLGCALGALTFVKHQPRWIPFSGKLLWAYALVSAIFILQYPALPFGQFHTAFQATSGQALAEMILIPYLTLRYPRFLWRILPYVMTYEVITSWTHWTGLLVAPSFDLAFLACYFPFAPGWLKLLTLVTILTHHANTATLILLAQLSVLAFKDRDFRWCLIPACIALVAIAYTHQRAGLFDSIERIRMLKVSLHFWAQNWKWVLFGVGPGTFMWTSIFVFSPQTNNLYLQLHSDWIQILWELGLVGFSLATMFFVRLMRHAWNDPRTLSALSGCAVFAAAYHPLRFFPSACLMVLILSYNRE